MGKKAALTTEQQQQQYDACHATVASKWCAERDQDGACHEACQDLPRSFGDSGQDKGALCS